MGMIEKIAKKLNIPRNHVIKDSKLVNLVKQMPNDIDEVEKLSLFEKRPAYSDPNATIIAPVNVARLIINSGLYFFSV